MRGSDGLDSWKKGKKSRVSVSLRRDATANATSATNELKKEIKLNDKSSFLIHVHYMLQR